MNYYIQHSGMVPHQTLAEHDPRTHTKITWEEYSELYLAYVELQEIAKRLIKRG